MGGVAGVRRTQNRQSNREKITARTTPAQTHSLGWESAVRPDYSDIKNRSTADKLPVFARPSKNGRRTSETGSVTCCTDDASPFPPAVFQHNLSTVESRLSDQAYTTVARGSHVKSCVRGRSWYFLAAAKLNSLPLISCSFSIGCLLFFL